MATVPLPPQATAIQDVDPPTGTCICGRTLQEQNQQVWLGLCPSPKGPSVHTPTPSPGSGAVFSTVGTVYKTQIFLASEEYLDMSFHKAPASTRLEAAQAGSNNNPSLLSLCTPPQWWQVEPATRGFRNHSRTDDPGHSCDTPNTASTSSRGFIQVPRPPTVTATLVNPVSLAMILPEPPDNLEAAATGGAWGSSQAHGEPVEEHKTKVTPEATKVHTAL
ncbi:uncharacterized protein [Equus caballus]|uniref:uncharacterized protein n=1 Tax=Equus caballus TaxID=9796 RepID=UPI0038B346CC